MTAPGHLLPDGRVPVLISAHDADLVDADAAALRRYAVGHPETTPAQIAEMLFRTRTARPHRALAMAGDRGELLDALTAIVDGRDHHAVVRTTAPASTRTVGYVFPGQGGQHPGMASLFYTSVVPFRAEADRCAQVFADELGVSPLDYLLDDAHPVDTDTPTVQAALFTQMAGLAAMWRAFGIAPGVAVGHSQGEIAAAYVGGAISLADAARVVAIRARVVDEFACGDYAMAVLAVGRDGCEDLLARCSDFAELSVVNSPGMTGICGDRDAVRRIVETLDDRGTFARLIDVRYPAHTSWIDRLGDRVRPGLRRALQNPGFADTDTACLGGTLGGPIGSGLSADQYWFQNLRNTVRFDKAVAAASRLGVDTFVELAEHPTLQLAIQENLAGDSADPATGADTRVVGSSTRTATDLTEFTRNLMLIAVGDLDYRWGCLRSGPSSTDPPPLPLTDFPNSAMNAVSLWLPYHDTAGTPGAVPPEPAPDPPIAAPRLLVERWDRLASRDLVAPHTIGIIDHAGGCPELAAALCRAAADLGDRARVLGTRDADTGDLDSCVILVGGAPEADFEAAVGRLSVFFADRDWWPALAGAGTDCWLVTTGGESVTADDPPADPAPAGIAAGFRGVGAEYPGINLRHLDLPGGNAPAESAATILSALHTRGEPELALRGGGVYAKRVVEQHAPPDAAGPAPAHVLIVGGTGNLGLEFCEHFARRGARRITLISRSGATSVVADRLSRIRSVASAHIDAVRCDIRDRAALSRLAEQYLDAPADVVVHAALAYSDIELADITAERAGEVLQAKVIGAWRVLRTFPLTGDCRVLLCSSAAASIGGRGQIVYAAANRMLDVLADRLRVDGLDCVSVQWGQWSVHFDLEAAGWTKLAATGLVPMRPADALEVGTTRLGRNFIVAAFDLTRARAVLSGYGYGPLLSELSAGETTAPVSPTVAEADPGRRLLRLVAETIGADRVNTIDAQAPMVSIGLDSLQALEFHRRVKAEFNYDLAVSDLLGGASLADVLDQLGVPT